MDTPYEKLDETKLQLTETHGGELARLHFVQSVEVYDNARQLVGDISGLIKELERERDNIMRDPLTARPNPLGILQGRASQVEAGVGEFVASLDALKRVEVALGLREPGVFA